MFNCAIEDAKRPGSRRCTSQCESCLQAFLKRDDGRPIATCETAGGSYFDYADPHADQITLDDVAHHLSVTARFAGATVNLETGEPVLYSVAEHAVGVAYQVINWGHPELVLAALHHDDHEYMLGDWPTPLKRQIRASGVTVLDDLVSKTNIAVGVAFGVDHELFEHPVVKRADAMLLYREAATYKRSRGIGPHWGRTEMASPLTESPWSPNKAKKLFIAFHQLHGGKSC